MPHVFGVSELTEALRDNVEAAFPFVWVRGEVSNLARPASGHVYFSLGDGRGVLPVAWFRANQCGPGEAHPLTGEVAEEGCPDLADGMEVLCAGRLTVYSARGSYQLVAELVQPHGAGELAAAFEALKRELAAEGYFEESRKMRPPPDPARVAVVTSLGGAALRDFLKLASVRGTGAEIRIHPALVQGDSSPASVARALREVVEQDWAQVVVVTRGGGSLEDLWAFNTREVADAVFACPLPVVSGVGHEIDLTIADLTADVRASTPSHAAQLLWPERRELAQRLDERETALVTTWNRLERAKAERLETLIRGLRWLSPAQGVERSLERLAALERGLRAAWDRRTERAGGRLEAASERLARAFGPPALRARNERLDTLARRLESAGEAHLRRGERRLENLAVRLRAASPEAPLQRGFALVRREDTGAFLRSPDEVAQGDGLDIRVRDGHVRAIVTRGEE
ncbi:exodeoxyribonuclease VII large subunit [Desulfohalovibrio reitneri]|uniref:exodeoxyribonuclease VII large subunit n=1 Tax=Desulfohalovibrio reitneri TaxID=1307759 RepID=UPI0004A75AC1|nr:exodeoxyribonuclease VII large subunit [Desulfohalovibrio reitneri]